MQAARMIPCLDVTDGRVVKGVNFVGLRDAGDPVEIAKRYNEQGADELTFLDITASSDQRDIILHVIEAVAEPLARKITEEVAIPTIGIGASAACDGQILVLEDMLGLSPRVPKFVKRYGNLGPGIEAAISGYADEVRSRAFPGPDQVYPMKKK